jgi:cell division protein YceG involved in septum cleavage
MRSKIKVIFILTFTLFLLSVSTFACTCVQDKIKAKGFTGQIFFAIESNPTYKEIIPKATVRLLKRSSDQDKVIAEVIADENGRFAIENVKTGTYILEVFSPNTQKMVTEIKIGKSSSRKKDELVIGLDPSPTGCCNGYAKVQKVS